MSKVAQSFSVYEVHREDIEYALDRELTDEQWKQIKWAIEDNTYLPEQIWDICTDIAHSVMEKMEQQEKAA